MPIIVCPRCLNVFVGCCVDFGAPGQIMQAAEPSGCASRAERHRAPFISEIQNNEPSSRTWGMIEKTNDSSSMNPSATPPLLILLLIAAAGVATTLVAWLAAQRRLPLHSSEVLAGAGNTHVSPRRGVVQALFTRVPGSMQASFPASTTRAPCPWFYTASFPPFSREASRHRPRRMRAIPSLRTTCYHRQTYMPRSRADCAAHTKHTCATATTTRFRR